LDARLCGEIEVVIYHGEHSDNLMGYVFWCDWSGVFHLWEKATKNGPSILRGGALRISLFHLKRIHYGAHWVWYCCFALFYTGMNKSDALEAQDAG
jgi:hypothetical protein